MPYIKRFLHKDLFDKHTTQEAALDIQQRKYGKCKDGREALLFSLKNDNGICINITNWGGIVTSIQMPDRQGETKEITLGLDTLDHYLAGHPYFGALIGRYANRIAKGTFELEGQRCQLACNDAPNHLHGGTVGFDKVLWTAQPVQTPERIGVTLTHASPHMEEGYPGNLQVTCRYTLDNHNAFAVAFEATTDQTTVVNLTNHCYWNLAGAGCGTVKDHQLKLNCSHYLPVDADQIPTGEIASVAGGPFDFRKGKIIGEDIDATNGGYDHCMLIDNGTGTDLTLAAEILEPKSGRGMRLFTTKPALQFYSGIHLGDIRGAGGAVFDKFSGLCLETQYYPDSPNKPNFSNPILKPGEVYHHKTIHQFFTD